MWQGCRQGAMERTEEEDGHAGEDIDGNQKLALLKVGGHHPGLGLIYREESHGCF